MYHKVPKRNHWDRLTWYFYYQHWWLYLLYWI